MMENHGEWFLCSMMMWLMCFMMWSNNHFWCPTDTRTKDKSGISRDVIEQSLAFCKTTIIYFSFLSWKRNWPSRLLEHTTDVETDVCRYILTWCMWCDQNKKPHIVVLSCPFIMRPTEFNPWCTSIISLIKRRRPRTTSRPIPRWKNQSRTPPSYSPLFQLWHWHNWTPSSPPPHRQRGHHPPSSLCKNP